MLVAILFLLKTEEEQTRSRPPNVIYEIVLTWDGESEDDLDLYVRAASGHTVSFNNREGGQGSLISLDHDALGHRINNSLAQGVVGKVEGGVGRKIRSQPRVFELEHLRSNLRPFFFLC